MSEYPFGKEVGKGEVVIESVDLSVSELSIIPKDCVRENSVSDNEVLANVIERELETVSMSKLEAIVSMEPAVAM